MALIRICYAADLPGPEEALKALRSGEPIGAGPAPSQPGGGGSNGGGGMARGSAQPRRLEAQPQAAEPSLRSFQDVIALIDARRDIALKLDVEKYLRLISFRVGAISFEPGPGAPNNLAQRLSARLKDWTGQPWLVAAEGGGGAETVAEQRRREDDVARAEVLADPFVRGVMETFPGAELVEVRQLAAPEPASAAPVEDDDEDPQTP